MNATSPPHPINSITAQDVPKGWRAVPVKEILRLQNGFPFKPTQWSTEGRPIIRIQNLNRPDAPFNFFAGELDERYLVRDGDLLFAWSGTPGTSFGAHIWRGGEAWLNQHIFNVKFEVSGLNKEFIRLAINRNLDEYVEQANGGVGLAHITKAKFDESLLLIPPEHVQDAIVAETGRLVSRVEHARKRLAYVRKLLKRLRQSVLAAACSGELTEDWRGTPDLTGWYEDQAQNVCQRVQSGSTPSEGFQDSPGIPFLKVYNLVGQKLSFDYKPQFVSDTVAKSRTMIRSTALPGDVLMNIVGPPLGKVAIVTDQYREWTFNQALTLFRPSERVSSQWLYVVLCSGLPYEEILTQTRGSAGQSNISLTQCREMIIPVPPVDEQAEIVRRVESLFFLAESIESRLADASSQVERTTRAIHAKAFRGELAIDFASFPERKIVTGPSDEPNLSGRDPKPPKTSTKMKTSLKEIVQNSEQSRFDPRELQKLFSGDYDSFRDQLYAILKEPYPVLKQQFDSTAQRIQLVKE